MILLRPDCLVFKTAAGESIPCSAQAVTIELIGDSVQWLDRELIDDAAAAVLHFFRTEKKQESVSVAEFSEALERVLRGFGLQVKSCNSKPPETAVVPRVIESDMRLLAEELGACLELTFFQTLRSRLHDPGNGAPVIFRFHGLRGCVKWLTGARRWSAHCQALNDQIVSYMRACLEAEKSAAGCTLVVS
jgi:hypothetical protein